jgi:predicted XRE-type DNA-binding protein
MCHSACPLSGGMNRHHHFRLEIGPGFLGVLEHCRLQSDGSKHREYDFGNLRSAHEESDQVLKVARRSGAITSISSPVAILGPAKWTGLSRQDLQMIQGIMQERTRKPAHVRDARVPVGAKRAMEVCPFLDRTKLYEAFGGNGVRSGHGYLIMGSEGGGWMSKCGFEIPCDRRKKIRDVRLFFKRLEEIRKVLGLIVVGWDAKAKTWMGWNEMRSLSTASLVTKLPVIHLRMYASEVHDRLSRYFENEGGFEAASNEPEFDESAPETQSLHRMTDRELGDLIKRRDLKQAELAAALGVSQSFISQMLAGSRPWPGELRLKAIAFLRGQSNEYLPRR